MAASAESEISSSLAEVTWGEVREGTRTTYMARNSCVAKASVLLSRSFGPDRGRSWDRGYGQVGAMILLMHLPHRLGEEQQTGQQLPTPTLAHGMMEWGEGGQPVDWYSYCDYPGGSKAYKCTLCWQWVHNGRFDDHNRSKGHAKKVWNKCIQISYNQNNNDSLTAAFYKMLVPFHPEMKEYLKWARPDDEMFESPGPQIEELAEEDAPVPRPPLYGPLLAGVADRKPPPPPEAPPRAADAAGGAAPAAAKAPPPQLADNHAADVAASQSAAPEAVVAEGQSAAFAAAPKALAAEVAAPHAKPTGAGQQKGDDADGDHVQAASSNADGSAEKALSRVSPPPGLIDHTTHEKVIFLEEKVDAIEAKVVQLESSMERLQRMVLRVNMFDRSGTDVKKVLFKDQLPPLRRRKSEPAMPETTISHDISSEKEMSPTDENEDGAASPVLGQEHPQLPGQLLEDPHK